MTDLDARLMPAKTVADALLYEGYVLYPYRASAPKNRLRWQFGILMPRACAAQAGEGHAVRTEIVAEVGLPASIDIRVRGLQIQQRQIEEADGTGGFRPVEALDTGDQIWTTFDEAVEHQHDVTDLDVDDLVRGERAVEVSWDGGRTVDVIIDPSGSIAGRVVRTREPVSALIRVGGAWCVGPDPLLRVWVAVDNTSGAPAEATRDEALARSLVAVHTLAAITGGTFTSTLDPPAYAAAAVATCASVGTFPVIIDDDVVLSSPIIVYDRPCIAPESDGDMFDATEIDEILALRVLTLTDEEKREARGTDPRSAAIVDRCDALSEDTLGRLHGTFRSIRFPGGADGALAAGGGAPELPWWEPVVDAAFDPWTDTVWLGDREVGKGARVRLRPSRRADAQDLFLAGLPATVEGVFHDVDGEVHLAVVVTGDAGEDLSVSHGRFLYFHFDEVELLDGAAEP